MENGAVASGQYRLKGEEGEELYRFSTENGCVKQEDYVPDYPAEDWVFTLEEMAAMAGDVIKWVPDNLSEIKDGFYIDNIDPKFAFYPLRAAQPRKKPHLPMYIPFQQRK